MLKKDLTIKPSKLFIGSHQATPASRLYSLIQQDGRYLSLSNKPDVPFTVVFDEEQEDEDISLFGTIIDYSFAKTPVVMIPNPMKLDPTELSRLQASVDEDLKGQIRTVDQSRLLRDITNASIVSSKDSMIASSALSAILPTTTTDAKPADDIKTTAASSIVEVDLSKLLQHSRLWNKSASFALPAIAFPDSIEFRQSGLPVDSIGRVVGSAVKYTNKDGFNEQLHQRKEYL